jgi:hypothetical protein
MSREVNRAARRNEARKAKNRKSGMAALSLLATTSLMSSYVSLLRTETSFAAADITGCNGSVEEIEVIVSSSDSEDVARIELLDTQISDSTTRCVMVTFTTTEGVSGEVLNFGYSNDVSRDYADLDLSSVDPDKKVFFYGNDVIFDFYYTDDNAGPFGSSPEGFPDSPIFTDIDLEVHDIAFRNSRVYPVGDGFGGVIRAESDLSIFGSRFYNNLVASTSEGSFVSGGAVWIQGEHSDLYVEDTQFIGNFAIGLDVESSAEGGGGAINGYLANSVTVIDSFFQYNGTTGDGGAIKAGNNLILQNSEFEENFTFFKWDVDMTSPVTKGGAVFAGDDASISSSVFRENGAVGNYAYVPGNIGVTSFGGAVYVGNGATITDSTFELNSASRSGGAIWAYDELSVSYTDFQDNTSDSAGGAIFLDYSSFDGVVNSEITGSSFTDNRSGQEGGAVFVRQESYVSNSRFDFAITISGSTFEDNLAQSEGGALSLDQYAYITNSTFDRNRSREDGGAIYLSSWSEVNNSTFVENMARDSGGAIAGGWLQNRIVFNTFKDNVSDSDEQLSETKADLGEALSIGEGDIVGNIFVGASEFPQIMLSDRGSGSILYNLSTGDDFLAAEDDFLAAESTNRGNVSMSSFALDSELRDNDTENFSQTLSLGSTSSAAYGFVPFSTAEGWLGDGEPRDQRGVLRTAANVNAGAFEGFISRSTSSAGSSGSAPAPFSVLVVSAAAPKPGAVVKVSGLELKKVTEIYVGEVKVKVIKSSDGELSFKLPKSVKGAVKIRFVGAGYEHIHILNINGSIRNEAVVPGFGSNSTKLTKAMKKEIKAFVEANAGLTTVTCKGFTSAPATRQDLRLARERGQVTCDYIKTLNPELTVKVLAGSHTNTLGKQVRRVRLEMQ